MRTAENIRQLHVDDIERATRYYTCVFDARVGADGALSIGRGVYALTTDPVAEPEPAPLKFTDPDVVVARAAARGGRIVKRCADWPEGRSGEIEDPFGHRWRILRCRRGR